MLRGKYIIDSVVNVAVSVIAIVIIVPATFTGG